MLWYGASFNQCLICRQRRLGVEKCEAFGWQGDLINRLIHRSWGEKFVDIFLDLSIEFSLLRLDLCLCSGKNNSKASLQGREPARGTTLVRSQPVLVQQLQHVVDDRVLSLGEERGLRKGRLGNVGTGILAAEFGDDVGE